MFHYLKLVARIFTFNYPYSRVRLFLEYIRLITLSILHHKLGRGNGAAEKQITFFGHRISFINYGELINLVEDIFIKQVYQFEAANESPFILDGGSNIGLSIVYFKIVYPTSCIYGFEPDPTTFALLKKNVDVNSLSNVQLWNVALWSEAGKSFLTGTPRSSSLQRSLLSLEEIENAVEVETRKLSDWIDRPVDLLKLDVEGAEVAIIKDLITERRLHWIKLLVVEFHPQLTMTGTSEFASLLTEAGMGCDPAKDVVASLPDYLIYARGQSLD
jgi:FkbM family methyltransferase